MRKLLGEHPGISYVKWDCNRKISDPGSPWLDACRQGNLPIDYVRGYEHVLDTLAAEFPDVTFPGLFFRRRPRRLWNHAEAS